MHWRYAADVRHDDAADAFMLIRGHLPLISMLTTGSTFARERRPCIYLLDRAEPALLTCTHANAKNINARAH